MPYLCTRTTPTATQTRAFANASPTIMPTAGNGNFRRPGVRAWQAIARLFMLFFRWWKGIVPFNVIVDHTAAKIHIHVYVKRYQSDDTLNEPYLSSPMVGNSGWLNREIAFAFAA